MVKKLGKSLRNNKKGTLLDILFLAFIAMIFALVALFGLHIATSINDEINERTDIFNTNAIQNTNLAITKYENAVDSGFLMMVILVGIVSLVLAALVRVHPIFIPLFFLGWLVVIFMSAIFSNIYQSIADNPNLAATAAKLAFIDNIMNIIPVIVGVLGIILMIVMYKIWSVDQ